MNIFKTSKAKKTALSNGWTLVTHETISVYVNIDNPNKFSIHDWDNDHALNLTIEKDSVEVENNRYNAAFKLSVLNRTLTLLMEPDED